MKNAQARCAPAAAAVAVAAATLLDDAFSLEEERNVCKHVKFFKSFENKTIIGLIAL